MRGLKIFCLVFFIVPLITSSQVLVDTFLINHGDTWHIKKRIVGFWELPKTKFGSFETVQAVKSKKYRIYKHKESEPDLSSETGGFNKTTSTTDSLSYSLTVTDYVTDSIFIDMIMRIVSENKHQTVQFGTKEQPDENASTTYWDETFIRIKSDTSTWHMSGLASLGTMGNDESFSISTTYGFKIGGKFRKGDFWSWQTSGYVFLYHAKQVAAIQLEPEINVWLTKDLNEAFKKVIGAAIICIIAAKTP